MEALKHFFKFFVFYIAILPAISGQSVTLNSTLIRGQYACPGQRVIFTCVLSDEAYKVVWTSDQYIGKNMNIELTHNLEEGHSKTSPINPSTVATLVTVRGDFITESSLQLTASASFPTATVGCSSERSPSAINFTLLEIPSVPRNVTAVKRSQGSLSDSDCVIHLQWQPPNNTEQTEIRNYTITVVDSQGLRSMTSSSKTINLAVKNCASDAVIRVSAVDACGREGMSSNDTLEELLVSNPPTSAVTVTTPNSQSPAVGLGTGDVNETNSSLVTIVGAVLGTALLLIVLVIAIIIAITIGVKMNSKRNRNRGRSQSRDETSSIMNTITQQDSSSGVHVQWQVHKTSPPERTGSPRIDHEMPPVDDGHQDPTTGSKKSKTSDQTKLLSVASNLKPDQHSNPSSPRASPRSPRSKQDFLRSMSTKVEEIAKSNSLTRGGSYKLVENSDET